MEEIPAPRIVKYPTAAEVDEAFNTYACALGGVAHAWNFLHERLGRLFVRIVNAPDRSVTAAIWYSPFSDRSQRDMLRAAVLASNEPCWNSLPKQARDDIIWLIEQVNSLGRERDAAVHAPCILNIDHAGTEMAASPLSGHRRTKELSGKNVINEFKRCEQRATSLSIFTDAIVDVLSFTGYTWPEKPKTPIHKSKKAAVVETAPL
jgi:hypothetical protein